ncbi:unnamed protein product, partial [Phaeothamnion confervicola]
MLYVRALPEDFNRWNVSGWDWDMALNMYRRLENWVGSGSDPVPDWHGTGGAVTTSPPEWVDEVAPFFLESCRAAGIALTPDFNAPAGREGAGMYDFCIKDGVRDSAAR